MPRRWGYDTRVCVHRECSQLLDGFPANGSRGLLPRSDKHPRSPRWQMARRPVGGRLAVRPMQANGTHLRSEGHGCCVEMSLRLRQSRCRSWRGVSPAQCRTSPAVPPPAGRLQRIHCHFGHGRGRAVVTRPQRRKSRCRPSRPSLDGTGSAAASGAGDARSATGAAGACCPEWWDAAKPVCPAAASRGPTSGGACSDVN